MSPSLLSPEDQSQIAELLASVAYLLDRHDYDRLDEVFAVDVEFDNPGRLVAQGLSAVIEAFKGITQPAISHHITNVIVTPISPDSARCLSKALAIRPTGVTAAVYTDTVRRDASGWRIQARSIKALG